jgi:hypothetical protein
LNQVAVIIFALPLLLGITQTAHAIDHKNLDEGRPLRLEDAYPIATGEIAVETGAAFTLQRKGPNRGVFPVQILYGVAPNLHVEVGTTLSTNPHELGSQSKSGDLELSGLYNFNAETLAVPAFGAKLSVNLPTGIDSSGVDVKMKGLVTKSFDRLSVHFNAAYEFLNGTRHDERDGRYELVLGASYPVGAPQHTRTTLIGAVFTEQAVQTGESNAVGAEIGFRYQLTPRIVIDAGVGTEFAGPADRSRLFGTVGISMGF